MATSDKYTLVKVADFGLSKRINPNSGLISQCGTQHYLAPEVQNALKYTNKVDIWSLGIILYNCFSGNNPFNKPFTNYNIEDSFKKHEKQLSNVSEEAKNIIREMLKLNAADRPSVRILLTQRNWLLENHLIVQRAIETMNKIKNK